MADHARRRDDFERGLFSRRGGPDIERLVVLGRQRAGFGSVQIAQHAVAHPCRRQIEYDLPCLQPDDARKPAQGDVDDMQARHQRDAPGGRLAVQLADGKIREGRIHGRYRLIGKQQIGSLIQHARHADPLQLPARKLIAALEQAVGQVEPRQLLARPGNVRGIEQRQRRLPPRPLAQTAGDDGRDGALARRDRRRLVHHADAAAQARESRTRELPGVALEHRNAPFGRPHRGAKNAQQRALARPGGADDRQPLAAPGGKRDCAQRALAIGVDDTDTRKFETHAVRPMEVKTVPCPPVVRIAPAYLISPADRAAFSMPS